jgi:diguanylate cyclase (GGDEF)-like protein
MAARESASPKYGRLKVIVAEDDDVALRALGKAIALLGHDVRLARDGQEAWETHQTERADVILSDVHMPRVDGLELCRRTRAAESESGAEATYTYFIFMTDLGEKESFLRGMDAGADDYHLKPIDIDELQARLTSAGRVLSLHRKLAQKNDSLRRDSQTSFRVARVDTLTGVGNRLRMNEDLEQLWARAKRYGYRCSAALADIDWFKSYNDRFGHLAGDEVLRRVARGIRGALRKGDGLYRYGGEEFLVILPDQRLPEAKGALERVRRAIERMGIEACDGRVVTVSLGVAELGRSDATPEAWLRRADAALYRAKEGGRNRVELDLHAEPS